MPTLLESPPAADIGPFADLIGGENGGPAYQTVAGRFSEVPKAEVVIPTDLGAFQDMVPGPGRDVEMPAVEQDLGIFQALVPESPTRESERALAEVPKPPDPKWINFEKSIENATGFPFHHVNNSIRVFGQSAGRYIFDGMQAFERGRAQFYQNPTPEAVQVPGDQLHLPDGSRMSKAEEDALEAKYRDELSTHAPAALENAAELKRRSDVAEANTPIDPALAKTVPARLAAAAGPVAVMTGESLIPGVGLPLMVMHGALATEQEALDAGATPEQAQRAAVRSAIGLAIFGGTSKLAAAAVAKVLPRLAGNPKQLVRFITQFTGQEAANETSSRVISAWNAAADAPEGEKVQAAVGAATETTLENTVMNTMYALAHAAKASRPQLRPPEAPTSPASEPVAPMAPESGATAETAQGVEPAREAGPTESSRPSEPEISRPQGPTSGPDVSSGQDTRSPTQTRSFPEPASQGEPRPGSEGRQPDPRSSVSRPEPTASEPEGNDWTTATQEAPAEPIGVADAIAEIQRRNAPTPAVQPEQPEAVSATGAKLKLKPTDESGFVIGGESLEKAAEAVERGKVGAGLRISGKRNDLNAATTARSTKLQKSFSDSERAQKEINKAVPNERRQAAIAVNMEAGGDGTLLAKWEGAAKGKAFKQAARDAQTLSPAEIAIRDKAKQAYTVLGARGQRFDAIGDKLRDNYVTHVWDVSKKFSGIGSSKLKDKFKFAKARKFETLFDGDQAGFTPKTMAIGKLLPAYMHEMNTVIADRQFVQDVSSGVAKDQRPLVIPKGNAKQVEANEYVVSPVTKFQRSVYDTAAEAQAALLPGQIVTPRRASATHVNPRGFASAKDTAGDPIDQSDYKVTDQHALSNWRWVNTDKEGNTTLLKSDLSVHPELAKRLNAMMGDSPIRHWYNEPSTGTASIPRAIAKGLDTAQSVMKREMFGLLAPFHQVQEGTHAIGHTVNPFFGIEDMSRPTPKHIDAMEHGLMILPEKKGSAGYIEGVGGKNSFLSQAARKFGGKAGRVLADTIDGYQNYLFHQYIPGLKYKTYEHVLARNMERYASNLKSGEVTVGDVKMLSTEQSNAAYGHLNYALLDRNPLMQHLMQIGLLAPDFLEARSRFVGQALRAPVSKAGHEQFRAIATIALIQAGAAYTLSQLLGDEWDPKHPFELTHNGRTYTMRSVPEDFARLFFSGADTRREFVSARINPVVQKIDQLRTGKNYRGEQTGAWETMGELLANYIPITARQIPGLRTLTETGRNQTVTPLEQLAGSLGLKISRHSPITKVYQAARDWKEAAGLPKDTGSYPTSKYQQLRYALEDGDMERAKTEYQKLVDSGEKRDKITSGFRQSILHAFTGSEANDAKFKKSLSPEDKQLYDLAVRKRHEILRRYQALRPSAGR